tara:strand:- start:336 stop:521 length:186 start_codon:yes stop_codon:yes gene_type:complete
VLKRLITYHTARGAKRLIRVTEKKFLNSLNVPYRDSKLKTIFLVKRYATITPIENCKVFDR